MFWIVGVPSSGTSEVARRFHRQGYDLGTVSPTMEDPRLGGIVSVNRRPTLKELLDYADSRQEPSAVKNPCLCLYPMALPGRVVAVVRDMKAIKRSWKRRKKDFWIWTPDDFKAGLDRLIELNNNNVDVVRICND